MKLSSFSRITSRLLGQSAELQCTSAPLRPGRLAQQWPPLYRASPGLRAMSSTPAGANSNTNKPAEAENGLSLSDQIRLLMRRVPYPVAIITATDPHEPTEKAFRGMTVSSFNTVTLSPAPTVSFNVRRPSETLAALQSSSRFLIHLLSPAQATAALARDFSKGNHNLSLLNGKSDFEFVPLQPTSDDGEGRPLPLLRRRVAAGGDGGDGTADFPFVFECRLHPQGVDVHDHTIVVGTVVRALSEHLNSPDAKAGGTSAADLCLTYANTRFWEMGHEI